MKATPCTIGKRHAWVWVEDFTNMVVVHNSRGTVRKLSRRGIYKCECGARREGQPRSGL